MSTAPENESRADQVVVARIVKARGIRGEVACVVETDFPGRFSSLSEVTIRMPGGTRLNLKLEDHWFHQDRVILKFAGYDTMTAAQSLVGGCVMVAGGDQGLLTEGEFFERHVIGSEAVTAQGQSLGRVTRLMRTGGTDVLVVEGPDHREYLIPFADDICTDVDIGAKRIIVNPPDGLLEL